MRLRTHRCFRKLKVFYIGPDLHCTNASEAIGNNSLLGRPNPICVASHWWIIVLEMRLDNSRLLRVLRRDDIQLYIRFPRRITRLAFDIIF